MPGGIVQFSRSRLSIGAVALPNNVILATMSGITEAPFRRLVKDYFLICESYFKAIRTAPPSQIEALDMGRRGLHDEGSALLVERLERAFADDGNATAYDLQAWYGRDYDRAVLKAEGERAGGELTDSRTELLWSHAVAGFWDAQLGIRGDGGDGPGRSWLAFGVQGLAPYWFEVEATGYLGQEGRSAVRLAAIWPPRPL